MNERAFVHLLETGCGLLPSSELVPKHQGYALAPLGFTPVVDRAYDYKSIEDLSQSGQWTTGQRNRNTGSIGVPCESGSF